MKTRDPAQDYSTGLQAQLVHTLLAHGIQAQAGGIERHPKIVRLFILPTPGTKHQAVLGLHREITAGLGLDCQVKSDRRGLYVDAALPSRYWRTLRFAGMLHKAMAIAGAEPRLQVPALLGLDEDGRIVFADLASATTPHTLLAGTTGSGKTNLLKGIILSLAAMNRPSRVQVFILDAKGYAFPPLAGLPHVQAVATEPDAWLEQAAHVIVAMEERLKARERQDVVHLVLVVDELVDLLMTDQERTGGGLAEALIRLTQKGREVGVHLLAATQKPSARVVNSLITSNLPCRLVGQVVSGADAALASGQRASGAQHLPGRGAFIMVAGGTMDAMTAPYVRDGDVELVRRLVRGDLEESEASEPAAKATSRIIGARAFLDKLRARANQVAPGRPAEPPPGDVIQHLVEGYYAGQGWPSRRAVQRMIAQAEGNKIASAGRADAALVQAQRSVQKAAMK